MAVDPIIVTELGITIDTRLVHPRKALAPMFVAVSGITTRPLASGATSALNDKGQQRHTYTTPSRPHQKHHVVPGNFSGTYVFSKRQKPEELLQKRRLRRGELHLGEEVQVMSHPWQKTRAFETVVANAVGSVKYCFTQAFRIRFHQNYKLKTHGKSRAHCRSEQVTSQCESAFEIRRCSALLSVQMMREGNP